MSTHQTRRAIGEAVTDGIARGLGAVGLFGVALIHLLDLPGKFDETPYMAWMYVGLTVSCVGLAGVLVATSDRHVWLATAALPATVIVGYVFSCMTGLF